MIQNTIAFGRLSDGPPAIHHPKDMYPPKPTVPGKNWYYLYMSMLYLNA